MRRWVVARISGVTRHSAHPKPRYLSAIASAASNVERIFVRCGSAGGVSVEYVLDIRRLTSWTLIDMTPSLHNIGKVSTSDPLMIYLPPYASALPDEVPQIPAFLRRYPTAVINYRWAGYHPFEELETPVTTATSEPSADESVPLVFPQRWPMPLHDTLQAYSWIAENLTPPAHTRRDVYVYGSYLGASLATSLSLTENHPHQRMGVRGCIAFNGIYNWTMFLPDHQINRSPSTKAANVLENILGQPTDPTLQDLKQYLPDLFGEPSNLFDPFASACLFFHTPGLLVPQEFDKPADPVVSMLGSVAVAGDEAQEAIRALLQVMLDKPPRRSPLAFPPRKSTLKIPETLLLHTTLPPLPATFQKRKRKAVTTNQFKTQAHELAALMRRSLEKLELKDRSKWDEDFDGYLEVDRRVQVYDIGKDNELFQIPRYGEEMAQEWLENRLGK